MANAFIEKLTKVLQEELPDFVPFLRCSEAVRAVLLAMREPSEEMVRALESNIGYDQALEKIDGGHGAWQSAIDRAIQD